MSPVARLTSKIPVLFGLLLACGCAVLEKPLEPPPTFGPHQEVFFDRFDAVWRAVQLALQKYPPRVNNMDKGILETDDIKSTEMWIPPHRQEYPTAGRRYRIIVRVIKGQVGGRPAMKVSVTKPIFYQVDFFSPEQKLPSDGLEEKAILYRIKRELEIDRALQKAHKQSEIH